MTDTILIRTAKRLLPLLAGVVVAHSCTKEVVPETSDEIRLRAGMGRTMTKGTASDDSGTRDYDYAEALDISLMRIDENIVGSSWPGFTNLGASDVLSATMSAPDAEYMREVTFASAQFYKNTTDHIRYASWYPVVPGSNVSKSAQETKITFPVDGATDVLYGSVSEGNKIDGFSDIEFNHALCQFNIYAYTVEINSNELVGGDGAGDADDQLVVDWGAVSTLMVHNIENSCVMTLPNEENELKYTFEYPTTGSRSISLHDPSNGIYWNPGTSIPLGFDGKQLISSFIAPPPAEGYISLSVATTKETAQQIVSIARNFQKGYAYDIVLRFTSHGIINAEVSVGDWKYQSLKGGEKITQDVKADMYYDLSAYRKANCYIVPAGNYGYSFEGAYKGNSSEAINPGYIDVLWSDNPDIWDPDLNDNGLKYGNGGNYFQLASHTLSKNRVMFKVGHIKEEDSPTTFDDKELKHKGNVVVAAYTDKTKAEMLWSWHLWITDQTSTVGFTNGYLALNLDLGATEEGGPGLYYQWGRKDPFAIGSDGQLLGNFRTTTNKASIDSTIQHPMTFYGIGASSSSWYDGDESDISGLWGWKSEVKDIEKSMYDPCPTGYTVADYRLWGNDNIAAYEQSYTPGSCATIEIANRAVRFPLSMGYLDATAKKNTSSPLFIWSSSLNAAGEAPYSMLYPKSGSSPVETNANRNYGGAVRCIARSKSVVKNLSSPQSANCYIVEKDGYYKFKATVAGNGVTTLVTNLGNEWDITGRKWGIGEYIRANFDVDYVTYLWYQPALDGEMPSSITTDDLTLKMLDGGIPDEDGYVSFEIKNAKGEFKKGNYVLAAYKDGVIKWSWHIWVDDTIKDVKSSFYTMLDRNIGATVSQPAGNSAVLASYGFYYQWGRKDPFIGPSSATQTGGNSPASSTWFKYSGTTWTPATQIETIAGTKSIKYATEHPSQMIVSGDDWMTGYSDSRNDFRHSLWGAANEDEGLANVPGKSCYDPCPPGYMVAHHWVFWNCEGGDNGSNNSSSSNFSQSGSYGYTCNFFSNNWFALCGQRLSNSAGAMSQAGTRGMLSISVPMGSYVRYVSIGSVWAGFREGNSNGYGFDTEGHTGNAMPIRCIKL